MLPDERFFRAEVPMTKQEVRAVSLAKLGLEPHHRALDIGAGTGSVTVEMALRCREVVAVEKDPEALAVLRENLKRFSLNNVRVVEGSAPKALEGLGSFDRIFLGGSGAELAELLDVLPAHGQGRVVANAICLETIATITERFRKPPFTNWEVSEVQVSRGLLAGSKIRMAALSPVWVMAAELPQKSTRGSIVGMGVGPGDPELLTLKAVKALSSADVVMTPRSRDESGSVALAIARRFVPAHATVEECTFPMSEERSVTERAWQEAAERLVALARQGRRAVFLTLGDSTLYSTWGYVLQRIQAMGTEVACETLPGVTSLSACAARAQVPLAEGRAPLVIWPGKTPDEPPLANAHMVFMKAGRNLRDIGNHLARWGRTGVAITNCGQENERITRDLTDASDEAGYFTTVIVGKETQK